MESAVQLVERWILARLRHQRLADVRAADLAVSELLPLLNTVRDSDSQIPILLNLLHADLSQLRRQPHQKLDALTSNTAIFLRGRDSLFQDQQLQHICKAPR